MPGSVNEDPIGCREAPACASGDTWVSPCIRQHFLATFADLLGTPHKQSPELILFFPRTARPSLTFATLSGDFYHNN
jgi:hypothetical protein